MRNLLIIITILLLAFISCENTRTQNKLKPETPKAFEDKSDSYAILSKRGYDDLIESLYNEVVSKNIDLKMLENKIEELNNSKNDSTNAFEKFNVKNKSYFESAETHISEIKDSLLRNKMKLLVADNFAKYNSIMSRQTELIKTIETKQIAISDLHNIIKIMRTLPLIEQYQKENLPNAKSLESYIKNQDQVIKFADTLSSGKR